MVETALQRYVSDTVTETLQEPRWFTDNSMIPKGL